MKIIVANLKMTKDYEESLSWASFLAKKLHKKENVIVCPSAICLGQFSQIFSSDQISVGAQDVSGYKCDAVTGDISARMLKSIGVSYAIVGHSERRRLYNLSDQQIRDKIDMCQQNGIIPIVCLPVDGEDDLPSITKLLRGVKDEVILAFEPEFAIGSGNNMDPESAERIISKIKAAAKTSLGYEPKTLYGGSVSSKNAGAFLSKKGIDGLLVGSACKDIREFCLVCEARS